MRAQLARDFARFGAGLPHDWPAHVRDTYGIDLRARYLGEPIAHPIGKGSGQLSLNPGQLERDAQAGLAFVVLKTVIAEDDTGERAMAAWAVPASRMAVERRRAPDGREGWTVTWRGRGWDRSFAEYLALVRVARDVTRAGGMPVVPSVKYHLPRAGEAFRDGEYRHTTRALADAWGALPLLLEQDFSPTLAGDALASERELVLRWVREVPGRIRAAVEAGEGEGARGKGTSVRVALKLMNARFDDAFQLEMLAAAARSGADALVVFNRLFERERGLAFGGWELSDRNLRALDLYRSAVRDAPPGFTPPLVGTGNVCSGRMVLEYARRGCECVQVHTLFQLPLDQYPATAGSRTQRALHALVFHPADGLVAGLLDLADRGEIERRDGAIHFLDLADAYRPR